MPRSSEVVTSPVIRVALCVVVIASVSCSTSDGGRAEGVDTLTHEVNGQRVARTTVRLVELEDPALVAKDPGASATAWVVEKIERFDDQPPGSVLGPDAVIAFVRDEWDASIGGAGDEGRNAAAFVETLGKLALTPERFIRAHRKLQAPLADFKTFCDALQPLDTKHERMGVEIVLDTLEEGGVTLAEVEEALDRRGATLADLAAELLAHERGAHRLRAAWKESGRSLAESLALGLTAEPQTANLFGITNPSWDIGMTQAYDAPTYLTRTAILNYQALDATAYTGGVAYNGPTFRDTWDSATVIVEGYVTGTYDGVHPTIGGSYLPDTYLKITDWHFHSDSLTATVSVTGESNVGPSTEDPVPQVGLVLTFKACSDPEDNLPTKCKSWSNTQMLTGSAGAGTFTDGS